MFTMSGLYDAILYIYALSLLFYFSDFARQNQSVKRIGSGLLIFVWIMQFGYILIRFLQHRTIPVFSMFEIVFVFSWLMVSMSLVFSRFYQIGLTVFFVNVVGFAVLALNVFSDTEDSLLLAHWGISDELLFIHISLAVGSYAAFALSAIFSAMYLFLHRKLKSKQWSSQMHRMPSLEKIGQYTFRSVMIGAPLLILSVALGFVWLVLRNDLGLLFTDLKVYSSLFVLAAYSIYLLMKLSLRITGNRLALYNLLIFAAVVLNFIFSNERSAFHKWF